jgi:hypothetical protein
MMIKKETIGSKIKKKFNKELENKTVNKALSDYKKKKKFQNIWSLISDTQIDRKRKNH